MADTGEVDVWVFDYNADKTGADGHADVDVTTHEFVIPQKEVAQVGDVAKWEHSQAYQDLLGFIMAMNEAIKNKKIRDDYPVTEAVQNIVSLLDKLDAWIDEVPPIDQPQRFGNKAFREWFQRLKENSENLLKEALDGKFHRAVPEIAVYLVESVGNSTRIDYGTGHELAFITYLCCMYKIGAFTEADAPAVVLRIFSRYLELMRKLQQTYRMEPAGSQGVWSLDDHQFICFLWGSAQLVDHKRLKPKSFPDSEMCDAFAKDYLFYTAVQYIHKVKTGPFAEHSNQLWNISGVALWSKVNTGLLKMYKAEVLSKFPIMQHFLFGSLMSIKQATQ